MIIVHELNQLDYGGAERVIRNIIKYDKVNKHNVIAYKDGPFKSELELIGANILIAPKTGEVQFDTDIIHIHSGGGVSEMAKELGKNFPVIETIHSPIRSPMRNEVISQRVGVTEAVSRINSNCVTIHNGIDFEDMVPTKTPENIKKELNIPQGIPIVGRLGRLGRDKGLEEWLLTCYHLQQRGIDFIPVIVGDEAANHNGYVGKLKLMAASLPVNNVVWVGHKTDIANYLQIMDVFLYPSPTEGFGLVFAEAMYMGAVVVTYDNDVTREVCGGFSVLTEKSIPGLVYGVQKALGVNMRDAIIPLAQSWAEEQFSAERMSKDYQELYMKFAPVEA